MTSVHHCNPLQVLTRTFGQYAGSRGRKLLTRERKENGRTDTDLARDRALPSMGVDDALHYGQPQSSAPICGGSAPVPIEHVREIGFTDARPGVLHGEHHILALDRRA